jgi:5-methylcytosine-specific restriction endonuclease McrA
VGSGLCIRCKEFGQLEQHHVLPKTHYHGQGKLVTLCHECHLEIEKIYLLQEGKKPKHSKRNRLSKERYLEIFCDFILGEEDGSEMENI